MKDHEFDLKYIDHLAGEFACFHGLNKQRVVRLLKKWWDGGRPASTMLLDTPLDKACSLTKPSKALKLLEDQNIDDIEYKDKFIRAILNSTYTPLFTIKELGEMTLEFIEFQEANRDHIIQTGFPKTVFKRSLWFDMHLSRLNYVKFPVDLPDTGGMPYGSDDQFENHLLSSVNENDCQQYNSIWIKEPVTFHSDFRKGNYPKRLMSYSHLLCAVNYKIREGVLYGPFGKKVEICSYEEAPVIEDLDPMIAPRLEKLREKVFNLRIDILKYLLDLLSKLFFTADQTQNSWDDCIYIIGSYLTVDEIKFLVEAGQRLASLNGRWTEGSYYPTITCFHFNAGLGELIFVIIHFLQELTIGMMDKTKKALMSITPYPRISSYFEAVGKPWLLDLDRVISRFEILAEQRTDFDTTFQNKFHNAIQGEEPIKTHITGEIGWAIKQDFDPLMSIIGQYLAEELGKRKKSYEITKTSDALILRSIRGKIMQCDGYYVLALNGEKKFIKKSDFEAYLQNDELKSKKTVKPFSTPVDSTWEKLTIEFFNEDAEAVEITYGGNTVSRDFNEMGMFDGRTMNKRPDVKWELLKALAKNNGQLEWSSAEAKGLLKKFNKKTFSGLRQNLQKIFPDLSGNPFKAYRTEKAYQTRFILRFKDR